MHTVYEIFLPSAAAAWHKNWNGTTFKLCKTTPEEFITTNMLKPTVEKVQLLSRFGDCFAQLSEVTPAVSVVTNEKGACIKTQVCVYGSDIALHWNFKFLAFLQVWVWGKGDACSSGDITLALTLHVLSMTPPHTFDQNNWTECVGSFATGGCSCPVTSHYMCWAWHPETLASSFLIWLPDIFPTHVGQTNLSFLFRCELVR